MGVSGRIDAVADRAFAAAYARASAAEDRVLGAERRALLAEARGTVVEIGAGTGSNLAAYPPVDRLLLLEPSPAMRTRLEPVAQDHGADVIDASAEAVPLPDAVADTVVATLVLCTVDDLDAALTEIRRILKPDGRLLLLEHVRSDEPHLARWQDRAEPIWCHLARGCHPNRDTLRAVERAGFTIESSRRIADPTPLRGLVPHVVAVVTKGSDRSH
jgi:ubiquinone/menaquinone biosynthesis C-methylase UbiE